MTIKGSAILIVLVVSLASCSNRQTGEVSVKEDLIAKQLLQGIWVNDETEMPLMRIEGDTVYYANPQSAPVPFKVVHDTIYIYSNEPVAYKIDRQTEYSFWFHSLADEVIKLHKSENAEDSLVFTSREVEVISTTPEVIKKDSIVTYKNTTGTSSPRRSARTVRRSSRRGINGPSSLRGPSRGAFRKSPSSRTWNGFRTSSCAPRTA